MADESAGEQDIALLVKRLDSLANHWVLRSNRSAGVMLRSQFLRGLAFGFGSVVGATIVVSVVGFMLAQLEVVPVIGDWATQIGRDIMQGNGFE